MLACMCHSCQHSLSNFLRNPRELENRHFKLWAQTRQTEKSESYWIACNAWERCHKAESCHSCSYLWAGLASKEWAYGGKVCRYFLYMCRSGKLRSRHLTRSIYIIIHVHICVQTESLRNWRIIARFTYLWCFAAPPSPCFRREHEIARGLHLCSSFIFAPSIYSIWSVPLTANLHHDYQLTSLIQCFFTIPAD